MTRDQLEFPISQYVDGTLSLDEVAALDEIFARDAEARAMLAEYRALDAMLKREGAPLPRMDWDRLGAQFSDAVAKEEMPVRRLRIWTATWTRVAVAALFAIAVGTALLLHLRPSPTNTTVATHLTPAPTVVAAIVNVSGPSADASPAAPVAVISIGPSALAQQHNARLAETIVYRPPRVVIASGQANRQDTQRLPY